MFKYEHLQILSLKIFFLFKHSFLIDKTNRSWGGVICYDIVYVSRIVIILTGTVFFVEILSDGFHGSLVRPLELEFVLWDGHPGHNFLLECVVTF